MNDKETVCSLVEKKKILAGAGIVHCTWTCPLFSSLQRANFTEEMFMKEKFQLSLFSLLYLVQSCFAKAKVLRAGLNFSILNREHK